MWGRGSLFPCGCSSKWVGEPDCRAVHFEGEGEMLFGGNQLYKRKVVSQQSSLMENCLAAIKFEGEMLFGTIFVALCPLLTDGDGSFVT